MTTLECPVPGYTYSTGENTNKEEKHNTMRAPAAAIAVLAVASATLCMAETMNEDKVRGDFYAEAL